MSAADAGANVPKRSRHEALTSDESNSQFSGDGARDAYNTEGARARIVDQIENVDLNHAGCLVSGVWRLTEPAAIPCVTGDGAMMRGRREFNPSRSIDFTGTRAQSKTPYRTFSPATGWTLYFETECTTQEPEERHRKLSKPPLPNLR